VSVLGECYALQPTPQTANPQVSEAAVTHGAWATSAANCRADRTAVVALTVNAGGEVWIFGGYAPARGLDRDTMARRASG